TESSAGSKATAAYHLLLTPSTGEMNLSYARSARCWRRCRNSLQSKDSLIFARRPEARWSLSPVVKYPDNPVDGATNSGKARDCAACRVGKLSSEYAQAITPSAIGTRATLCACRAGSTSAAK